MTPCRDGGESQRDLFHVKRPEWGFFHRRHRAASLTLDRLSRWPHAVAAIALLALGALSSSCTGIASPRGWASPVLTDDLVLVSGEKFLRVSDEDGTVETIADQ